MATTAAKKANPGYIWEWEGKDKSGKMIRGELRAESETVAKTQLRRQGINVAKIRRRRSGFGKRITEKDITLFTRQLSTMMRAGVPLLQAFDIAAKGHSNPAVTRMLLEVRADVETGLSLAESFRKRPLYFDKLFCNIIAAGEAGGVLDTLLDKLATYKEKVMAIKSKIKSAMIYPSAIVGTAFIITAVIMIYVIPAFKDLFSSFGANLPAPTLFVIWLSDQFVHFWWLIFGTLFGAVFAFFYAFKRTPKMQEQMDRILLRLPVIGDIIRKATIARWARTLSTLFSAGVPLVEALDSVGGAAGNQVYAEATRRIQSDVSTGSSLSYSMQRTDLFPNMVLQMTSIGEESGSLDQMLDKVADFYEEEVDNAVAALSSLLEPAIMVILGILIGGLVIAMYMPIFKMGQVVG
ncbi:MULTISPECIES: type II secretion system F family protein [Chromobacteriaceae]|uniref:Type II secretion system protein F n=1 Tax=Pseudogulbenkiania ferrooxidans EGD-HP2 TaxID=1388764 RepID=A0ABN0N0X0_9NEIS|nr:MULTISPECIES: type II secretion system F family protein [Chromobacteriaceae]AVG14512.1 type II secretion system protein F [Chromobacterium vaccinii]ERD99185.1 type II secretion system protein F [Pseudogulbenkiania ferrooxidans EGD-HP2]